MSRDRRVITRSGAGFRGRFPSESRPDATHYEGTLERDALMLLTFSRAVSEIHEQQKIEAEDEQGRFYFYPDFKVFDHQKLVCFYEIKSTRFITHEVSEKLVRQARFMARTGRLYEVVKDDILLKQPRLENMHLLLRYRSRDSVLIKRINSRSLPTQTTIRMLGEQLGGLCDAYSAVANQVYWFDHNLPIGPETTIWKAGAKDALLLLQP